MNEVIIGAAGYAAIGLAWAWYHAMSAKLQGLRFRWWHVPAVVALWPLRWVLEVCLCVKELWRVR